MRSASVFCGGAEAETEVRSLRRGGILLLILNSLFLLFLLTKPVTHTLLAAIDNVFSTALSGLAGLICLVLILRRRAGTTERRTLLPPLFFALGSIAYAIGNGIWTYYEVGLHRDCPFPSWADAGYLCAYPLLALGILTLPGRSSSNALRGRVALDSLMMMTGLVTFSWYLVLGPTLMQGAETPLAKALGAAYPLCDLVLLFCVLMLTNRERSAGEKRVIGLLTAGLLAIIVADTNFCFLTLKGVYKTGVWTDTGWTVGYSMLVLGGYAAALRRRTADENSTLSSATNKNAILWRSLLPYAFLPAVAVLLWYTTRVQGDEKLEAGVYLGSALLIALLLLRQVFAMLENTRLHSFLKVAYEELEHNNAQLAEANARLEALATTDGMTGLANHRTFQERLRAELDAGRKSSRNLTLLLLDVDRFKSYNDTFGHPAGDEALRIVARILRESVPAGGLTARYGGEEFAVILPGCDLEAGLQVAEQIRAAIAATEFPLRRVTASIGVTSTGATRDPESLIANADAGLYAAKQAGRNRAVPVCVPLSKAA